MKKVLSLVLSLVILLTAIIPALSASAEDYVAITNAVKVPVIFISGDADPIYDAEGNKLLDLSDMSDPDNTSDNESDKEELMESIANILYPFLVDGLLNDKWDNYYENLQKEIGELLGDALLDCNGEVTNGSKIAQRRVDEVEYARTHDKKINGEYYYTSYRFWYDWRRDPIEVADDFNEYIKDVKESSHMDKVAVVGRCLGTSVVLAYVEKYGLDDICGIGFDGGISNGAEAISEIISGKFKLDGNAISRFLVDCNAFGLKIDSLISSSIDLLAKGHVLDSISEATKETIYYRVIKGVTSALALSTAFTWPSYWAGVTAEDYETAKNYVFGPEGSEKRVEYAGLIAKIDNYDKTVRQHIPDIIKEIGDDANTNLAIISKYGMQMFPCVESRNNLGDQFVSVKRSSFGATASTIYDTLSDDYISSVVAAGKGKYISPDKQVDASTCMYPDYTWFVKGASHTNWTDMENHLLMIATTHKGQMTVDDTEISQFMVFDNESKVMSKMTTDNCDCYNWAAKKTEDKPETKLDRVFAFLKSLFNWLVLIFKRISPAKAAPAEG